jgi:hypothetical protein
VDLRAGLDDLEKRKFLTLPYSISNPSVVQPVASRYTDYAIPADNILIYVRTCATLSESFMYRRFFSA